MKKRILLIGALVLCNLSVYLFVIVEKNLQISSLQFERELAANGTFAVTKWYVEYYGQNKQWPDTNALKKPPFDSSTAFFKSTSDSYGNRVDLYEIVDGSLMYSTPLYLEITLYNNGECTASLY